MDSRAQHAPLITTPPLSAAVLISPPSRPGEKRGLDFDKLSLGQREQLLALARDADEAERQRLHQTIAILEREREHVRERVDAHTHFDVDEHWLCFDEH